jgi:hypothetical protein
MRLTQNPAGFWRQWIHNWTVRGHSRTAVIVRCRGAVGGGAHWSISPRCAMRVAGRPPSPAVADALAGRSYVLRDLGRYPEAAEEARRALAAAPEVGHPVGEALAPDGSRALR